MSKQTNYKINIYLRFIGIICLTIQLVQFFNGLWAFDTKVEIFMLVFFGALAVNPTKYLDKILDAILTRIKGMDNSVEVFERRSDTGGTAPYPEDEEPI